MERRGRVCGAERELLVEQGGCRWKFLLRCGSSRNGLYWYTDKSAIIDLKLGMNEVAVYPWELYALSILGGVVLVELEVLRGLGTCNWLR